MLKNTYHIISCAIPFFYISLSAQQQINEEYIVKRLKDNSFCILKRQIIISPSGLTLIQTMPVEKLPKGYSLEEENTKDVFIRIAKKHGPYLLLTLCGVAVATEQPRKAIVGKCIEIFEIKKAKSKELVNNIINLAQAAFNSLFLGAAWQTLLDVYKGKQPKIVKKEVSSHVSTFFSHERNN